MIALFIFGTALAISTVWIGFLQFHREKRRVLGSLLYIIGGVTTLAAFGIIPLIAVNSLFGTSGEQFDWGPFGSYIAIALLTIFYGGALCLIALLLTPFWIWISKAIKRQAQQGAAANP